MGNSRFIITVLILLASVTGNYYVRGPDLSPSRKDFSEFPKVLADWTAVNECQIDDASLKILQLDDYVARSYRNPSGEMIDIYIGYFTSQREGKSIHSPRQCLPGAGWVPVAADVWELKNVEHNQQGVLINKYVMTKRSERQLFLFWYQGRRRVYASEYWNKVYLIWDGLTRRRTDGALVRINSRVNGNTDDALKTQYEFIKLIYPILNQYVPD